MAVSWTFIFPCVCLVRCLGALSTWCRVYLLKVSGAKLFILPTMEPDLIATEMLAFPSKPSRSQNGSEPVNEKTTPILGVMGIISVMNSNDSINLSSLFSLSLDHRYQIRSQQCAVP